MPGKITLPRLHDLLQLVMGWTNSHLHSFEIGERTFGMDGTDLEELNMLNEKKFTLDEVAGDSIREFGGASDPAGFDLNEINRTLRIGPRPYGQSDADR